MRHEQEYFLLSPQKTFAGALSLLADQFWQDPWDTNYACMTKVGCRWLTTLRSVAFVAVLAAIQGFFVLRSSFHLSIASKQLLQDNRAIWNANDWGLDVDEGRMSPTVYHAAWSEAILLPHSRASRRVQDVACLQAHVAAWRGLLQTGITHGIIRAVDGFVEILPSPVVLGPQLRGVRRVIVWGAPAPGRPWRTPGEHAEQGIEACHCMYALSAEAAQALLNAALPLSTDLAGSLRHFVAVFHGTLQHIVHGLHIDERPLRKPLGSFRVQLPQRRQTATPPPRMAIVCDEPAGCNAAATTRQWKGKWTDALGAAEARTWQLRVYARHKRPGAGNLRLHEACRNVSRPAAVFLDCLDVLSSVQGHGGACMPSSAKPLPALGVYLYAADVVVVSGVNGMISPSLLVVTHRAQATLSHFRSSMMTQRGCTDTRILEAWRYLAQAGHNVSILPTEVGDAWPVALSSQYGHHPSHAPSRTNDGESTWQPNCTLRARQQLNQYPPHAAAAWQTYQSGVPLAIPKVLHLIWSGSHLPREQFKYLANFSALHPRWHIHLWQEAELDALPITGPALRRSRDLRQKSDLARYEIIWTHGGLYLDTDFHVFKNLDPLLEGQTGAVCNEAALGAPREEKFLSNGMLAFAPGHPAVRRALWLATRAPSASSGSLTINHRTGPFMFRRAVRDSCSILQLKSKVLFAIPFEENERVQSISSKPLWEQFPASFALHMWHQPGQPPDSRIKVVDVEALIDAHNSRAGQV